jgi:hypothetical protein
MRQWSILIPLLCDGAQDITYLLKGVQPSEEVYTLMSQHGSWLESEEREAKKSYQTEVAPSGSERQGLPCS